MSGGFSGPEGPGKGSPVNEQGRTPGGLGGTQGQVEPGGQGEGFTLHVTEGHWKVLSRGVTR